MNLIPPVNIKTNTHSYFSSRSSGLEAILLLGILIISYIFLLSPKLKELNTVQVEQASLKAQKLDLVNNASTVKLLSDKLKSSGDQVALLDEALPLNDKVTTFNLLLNQLIQQSGMIAGNINVVSPDDNPVAGNRQLLANYYGAQRGLKTITANIEVNGTIDQLQSLLKKIETSARLIDISSISVASGKNNSLTFTILLTGYAYE